MNVEVPKFVVLIRGFEVQAGKDEFDQQEPGEIENISPSG
jgi:hypothetical protein